jgi:hypothetical protein
MRRNLIYISLGTLIAFFFSLPLIIKVEVKCSSQFGECPQSVNVDLANFNGKNIYTAKSKISGILNKNLMVADFSLQYKIPNIINVNLLIKKAEFALKDETNGKVALVDKEGKIMSVTSESSLPMVLIGNVNFEPGQKVSDTELFALKIIRGIWIMYQVQTLTLEKDSLTVDLPNGIKVILPLEGDTDVLLGSLRLIYGRIENPESLGKYSSIDLRFKNPILK